MKVRAKKLAVLMLAGTLVLSGFAQPKVVNAEETGEVQTEGQTDDTALGKEQGDVEGEPVENITGETTEEPAKIQKKKAASVPAMATKATTVAKVGNTEYESLKQAFAEAPNNATIELTTNIDGFKTEDIVTIPKGKKFTFNMSGNSINVDASKFEGRIFVNNGELTITGDGIIDTSAAKDKGWGPVDNYGTLTIESGTYKAVKETDAVGIWNRAGGTAYFKGGTYEGFPTIIRSAYGSTTIISGGTYTNNCYPAIDNDGEMTITGGKFKNTSCSSCSGQWGYTVRNGVAGKPSHLVIEEAKAGSVSIVGVQGALANSCGLLEVKSGSFETVACEIHGKDTAHYALYVAGENGDSKAIVTGGTFKSVSKTAVLIGNDNTNGDGGINANATTEIKGGTFIAPEGQKAVTAAKKTGNPSITGGIFKSGDKASDMSQYLPSGMKQDENGQVIVDENAAAKIGDAAYDTLADAIEAVKDGETIELTRNVTDAEGISVPSGKKFTIDFKEKEYIVTGPGAGFPNTKTNAFQFLKDSTITMKNGTIKVGENASEKSIYRIIQNYADLTLEDMTFETANLGKNEDCALSFNNGNIVFKGKTSIHTSDADVIAFDVCKFSTYPSVNVTFDESFTGKIEGKIVYDSTNASTHTLTIKGNGSFAGIDASKGNEKNAEESVKVYGGSFGESVEEYVADKLEAELKKASSEYPYSYYATMEEALANAGSGDVVKDLTAPEDAEVFTITLDYGYDNKVVTIKGTSVTLPELQREGYKFLGWFVGDKTYKPGEVAVTGDTKFTAKWEKVQTPEPKPEEKPNQKPTPNQNDKPAANKSDKPVSKVPKTGDTANVAGYMTVMVLAAGMVAVALRKKRRA